jgi:hypothetical protein
MADSERTNAGALRTRLAERGYTTFTFDFCGFGESAGEPRQAEIPDRKIADLIAAAEFLSTLSLVEPDTLSHLAICASAQYRLAALARGSRVARFISIAGWYHDTASVAGFYGGLTGVARRLEPSPASKSRGNTADFARQLKDFGHTRERSRQFQALPMARVVLRRHVWLAM